MIRSRKGVRMLSVETLLLFVSAITLLIIIPGPDFAIVSKISLLDGRSQGQAAACGVALGMCLHTLLAMLGISAILAQSAMLFTGLKYIGAIYLFYLGIKEIWQSFGKRMENLEINGVNTPVQQSGKSLSGSFWIGFLTNALNPKAILYFIVLYPQFLEPSGAAFFQFLEMGLTSVFICLFWFLMVARLMDRIRSLFSSANFQRWLMRVTGGIFVIFGLKLAAQEV